MLDDRPRDLMTKKRPEPKMKRAELIALKAQVDLVDLLAQLGRKVREDGRGYWTRCPFHPQTDKKSASLCIDRKNGLYQCKVCGKTGDQLTFVQDYWELSDAMALEELKIWADKLAQLAATSPKKRLRWWQK